MWGGRDTLRITRHVEEDSEDPCDYLGIAIAQINYKVNRKRVRDSGFNEKLIPIIPIDSLFISHTNVPRFAHLIAKTNAVMQLQWEIRAQHYATFQIVTKKIMKTPDILKKITIGLLWTHSSA